MLSYLLHTSVLLIVSFVFYQLLLRKETFFRTNRLLLIGLLITACCLPLLKVPTSWSFRPAVLTELSEKAAINTSTTTTAESTVAPVTMETAASTSESAPKTSSSWNWPAILLFVYLLGVLVFLIAFWVQFMSLLLSRRGLQYMQDGPYRIYELEGDQPPFSFLQMIFINPSAYDYETFEQILAHEKIHIDQRHYLDILLAELLVIAFWFNPAAWGLRKAITRNLEYATDAEMLSAGAEKKSYQMSLVKVSVSTHALQPATNYNQSFLAQRIDMMNSRRSSLASLWKYLSLLPLFLLLVLGLNTTSSPVPTISGPVSDQSRLVIDNLPDPAPNQIEVQEELARPRPAEVPIVNPNETANAGGLALLQGLRALGYEGLQITDLNALFDNGIDAEYIQNYQQLGFSLPSIAQLIETKVHEVTTTYIESIRATGYTELSLRDYIDLRIHSIPPAFLQGLNEVEVRGLNKGQIVEAWVLEVDGAYIQSICSEGISPTNYHNYKEAKVHGVTPDFIRTVQANGLASNNLRDYTQLKLQTGSLLRSSTNQLSQHQEPAPVFREFQSLELPTRSARPQATSWSSHPIIDLNEMAHLKRQSSTASGRAKGPHD